MKMLVTDEIRERLKKFLADNKMTCFGLANVLGIKPDTVRKCLSGKTSGIRNKELSEFLKNIIKDENYVLKDAEKHTSKFKIEVTPEIVEVIKKYARENHLSSTRLSLQMGADRDYLYSMFSGRTKHIEHKKFAELVIKLLAEKKASEQKAECKRKAKEYKKFPSELRERLADVLATRKMKKCDAARLIGCSSALVSVVLSKDSPNVYPSTIAQVSDFVNRYGKPAASADPRKKHQCRHAMKISDLIKHQNQKTTGPVENENVQFATVLLDGLDMISKKIDEIKSLLKGI